MTTEVLQSLDLSVLLDDHNGTFFTRIIPEATGMTRIATALATILSLAFTPLAAQQTDCDGWVSSDRDVTKIFWKAATAATVADCLSSGSDVSATGTRETTPLHNAARLSVDPEVLNVLLDAGADGTAVNGDDETPLDLAKDNEALAGTDAYWALNDARFE
jgi:hypothetical protein